MNSVAMLAGLDVIVHVCLVTALIRTSYVMMVMVNSCSLLAVVVIAACCTGVREDYVDGENGDGNRNRIESNNGRNNSIGQDNDRQNNNT